MKSPATISVQNFFKAQSLHSREQAQDLFVDISSVMHNHEPVWIDFSDIEFISRSFADELIYLKTNSKRKAFINFCCTSIAVQDMLEAVTHTQVKRKIEKKLPVHQFDSMESLLQFFSKI